jgi:hypothetical protein
MITKLSEAFFEVIVNNFSKDKAGSRKVHVAAESNQTSYDGLFIW